MESDYIVTEFLNNVKSGKNNLWRYLATIFISFGLGQLVGYIAFFISGSLYFTMINGSMDVNLVNLSVTNPYASFILLFFMFGFSFLFLFISLRYIHKRDFMSLVNASNEYDKLSKKGTSIINRIRWRKVLRGFLIWTIFMLLVLAVYYVIAPSTFQISFDLSILWLLLLFLLAIPIQVTFEELFFRGYISQGLSLKIKSPLVVIILSSLIFGLFHVINGGLVPIYIIQNLVMTFLIGFIFCIVTVIDNGIEWAVGAHLANNFHAMIVSSSKASGSAGSGTLIQSIGFDPMLEFAIGAILLVIFIIALYCYRKSDILKTFKN